MVLAALVLVGAVSAAPAGESSAGEVLLVRGDGEVTRASGEREPLRRGLTLATGDTVVTKANSVARLLLKDKSIIDIGADSRLQLADYTANRKQKRRKSSVKLTLGRLWARVSQWVGTSDYEVETETAVAGVRGTEFIIAVTEEGETELTVRSGSVGLEDLDGDLLQEVGAAMQALTGGGSVTVREIQDSEWQEMTDAFALGFAMSEEELAKLQELQADRDDEGRSVIGGPFYPRPLDGPVDPTLPLEPGAGFGGGRSTVGVEERND